MTRITCQITLSILYVWCEYKDCETFGGMGRMVHQYLWIRDICLVGGNGSKETHCKPNKYVKLQNWVVWS